MADDIAVTADRTEGPVHVTGTDHVTAIGSNPVDTVAFYRGLLGMPLVLRQPNLDRPEVEHLFFDVGDGRLLTFFVDADRETDETPVDPDVGGVHHLAFRIDADRVGEVKRGLDDTDHRYSEFDRGAFYSLYTRDPNGLTVELVADKFAVPDDRRGEVLALAHRKRVADDATHVETAHLRAAIEALGLPVERNDVPDAPSGRGV
ncbi:VOC family protein [Haloplanus sp. GCM10025708]|uniref:VOC family protein n=1 Tax=Haloferacaceae TaxID=1644056 RepID=UPI00360ED1BC